MSHKWLPFSFVRVVPFAPRLLLGLLHCNGKLKSEQVWNKRVGTYSCQKRRTTEAARRTSKKTSVTTKQRAAKQWKKLPTRGRSSEKQHRNARKCEAWVVSAAEQAEKKAARQEELNTWKTQDKMHSARHQELKKDECPMQRGEKKVTVGRSSGTLVGSARRQSRTMGNGCT